MNVSRRSLLRTAGVAAVVGFNPITGLWVTKADAQTISIPGLDGQLFLDQTHRQAVAQDWGGAVSRVPVAVLQPGSVNDIVKVVQFCRPLNIKVGARGQAHTAYGQSQVGGGVVIDMSTLASIYSIQPD